MLHRLAIETSVTARRAGRVLRFYTLSRSSNLSRCSVCTAPAAFTKTGPHWREHYVCSLCGASPRSRAFMSVLEAVCPAWRDRSMHESSPWGAASEALARECRRYVGTHYYPDVSPGSLHNGLRCENLERLTFADASFDLVVTQDVMEHILDPAAALSEIARTLVPGGFHVFTVPFYDRQETLVRATRTPQGIEYLEPPQYHGNPIDGRGSLVTREWGSDIVAFIDSTSGLRTKVYGVPDRSLLTQGHLLYVFVSQKTGS
jgi:SAM-dependent methyltransferase